MDVGKAHICRALLAEQLLVIGNIENGYAELAASFLKLLLGTGPPDSMAADQDRSFRGRDLRQNLLKTLRFRPGTCRRFG